MLPACCLPLWGREGGTLLAAAENKRITGKRGFQQNRFLDLTDPIMILLQNNRNVTGALVTPEFSGFTDVF
jgi:hypothetical protein